MTSIQTKILKNDQHQVIHIPKVFAFPESVKDVETMVIGNRRIIIPAGQLWSDWFDAPDVSDDFMAERKQPEDQMRGTL